MALLTDFLEQPTAPSTVSRYGVMSGLFQAGAGLLLIVWPGVTQALLMERAFVGDEQGLVRVVGALVLGVGWLGVFGGRTGSRQFAAASAIERLVFVPVVCLAMAAAGVFPRLLVLLAIADLALAVGGWVVLRRADSAVSRA